MSTLRVKKAIMNSGANKNPKFLIFYNFFGFFFIFFGIFNVLLIFTNLFDNIINNDIFVWTIFGGTIIIFITLIIFGIIYLLNSKQTKESIELENATYPGAYKITGWKAVLLFFGISIVVAVLSVTSGQ